MPDLLPFLGEIALRSSLVLAATFACLLAITRASASERHLVLLLGLLMTALVPAGLLLSPKITWTITLPHPLESSPPPQRTTVPVLPENENSTSANTPPVVGSKPSLTDFCTVTNGLITLFAGGMLMQVAMLGRAVWTWRRIGRRAEKALLPDDVLEEATIFAGVRTIPPIFTSDQITVPLLSGWLQPSIILPSQAARWPAQRLLMALCHELAHFKRGDSLLTPLICFLRVFYWWHPLVWLALARMRRERENACDDLVLNQNFRPSDYADLIISTARQAQALRWQDGALAMASSSNVGERIEAILNPELNRRQTSRTTVFTGLILAFSIGWFFVAAQVQAEDQPATLGSKATTDPSKPQIKLEFRLIAIDEKTYLSHQNDIDTAVANSDLVSCYHRQPSTGSRAALRPYHHDAKWPEGQHRYHQGNTVRDQIG
jgi:beta-lactamase regulating signal transducer with metallopeptidase domain